MKKPFSDDARGVRSPRVRRRFVSLASDERGVAFYYTAIILFFILSILTVIYDVSRVSEKKTQMQVAADAAALEMAVWQARGMNMVQNLNDEIYDIDEALTIIYGIAGGITAAGIALEALSWIPVIGEALEAAGEILEALAAVMAQVAYYTHKLFVVCFLGPLRTFYVYGSMLFGYIGANNVAYANGAERIIPKITGGSGGGGIIHEIIGFIKREINDMTGQFVAIGIPTSPYAAIYLPLSQEDAKSLPLNVKNPEGVGGKAWTALMLILCANQDLEEYCGGGGEEASGGEVGGEDPTSLFWVDDYYASRDSESLKIAPMIWMVHASSDVGLISEYLIGGNASEDTKIPILAYAVGQALGGNVTKKSDDDNPYRPVGKGVSADAFLVPMNAIDFSKSVSANGVTLELSFQDYLDKLFPH